MYTMTGKYKINCRSRAFGAFTVVVLFVVTLLVAETYDRQKSHILMLILIVLFLNITTGCQQTRTTILVPQRNRPYATKKVLQ